MVTKSQQIELVRRVLSGGNPSSRDRVRDAEIEKTLEGAINSLLKTEAFNVTYNFDGASIPDGTLLATYEQQVPTTTTQYGAKAYLNLPATPVMLPERLGVFYVARAGAEPGTEYIPITMGQYALLKAANEFSSLLSRNPYVWEGRRIYLYDSGPIQPSDRFDIKLCIADLSTYGPNDPLPLSPELAVQARQMVVDVYMTEPRTIRDEGLELSPRKGD